MALSNKEEKAIKELRWKLSKSYAVKDFKVYGFKATGTDDADSDIDVIVQLGTT